MTGAGRAIDALSLRCALGLVALPFLDELAAAVPHARKLRTPGILTAEATAATAALFLEFLAE